MGHFVPCHPSSHCIGHSSGNSAAVRAALHGNYRLPVLSGLKGNSLDYMKQHKWQLLLKGKKRAVYKLRSTVCPQQGQIWRLECKYPKYQIWRLDCKYPKYHRGLKQIIGVLPSASLCKGKGQDFILHMHRKKYAQVSWIKIFVK